MMSLWCLVFYWCTCAFVYALDIGADCEKECHTNLYESTSTGDVNCNDTCRVTQCCFGCEMWKGAASSSCDDVCNQTFERQVTPTKHLHCNIGCHFAASLYIQSIKDELSATPSAPVLVAETQTNVSVGIRWKGPSVPLVIDVSYLVQWKYESLPGATWEYYRPKVPIMNVTSQIIEGLQPYTKYKFRVAWIVLSKHDLIFSEESVCISTLPYGPPSTAPIITSISALDGTRLSVTWEPPWFSNGPILSYVVHLYQQPEGFTLIKDIPGPNADNFFIFSNLQSNTTYIVVVACRNSVGEGPRATQNITTLLGPQANESTGAFLIVATEHNVVKLDMQNMMDEVLYKPANSSVQITGMASHFRANLFFVSDSLGDIHRVPIHGSARSQTVVTPSELYHKVTLLSVDWLNDKLYLVEKRQISRCDLDGSKYEVILTGLSRIPSDLKVDPYYGYLYWVVSGPPSGGLYRLDLEQLGTSVLVQDDGHLLVQDNHLFTLAIDHHNFCVLLANDTENTVYAVSLSGSELTDVRHNTQQPKFKGTKAMAIYKDLLYWATADQVYEEEHLEDVYYHNSILVTEVETPFVALDMAHSEAQPVPVPVNPVRNVQALFHDVQAQVVWRSPKSLGGLGRGAWQRWHYEITVNDSRHNVTVSRTNITSTSYALKGLEQNTSYSIKVRAYSESGTGPWSQVFTGTTLKSATEKGYPYILWSSNGLLKSDMVGNNVQPVISSSNLENSRVIEMSWYNELLFLNTNESKVFVYNVSNHLSPTPLANITSAISVAVDWLGRKIYWSNAKQQMISRANLDGSQIEPLLILTIAKELNIDSVNGRIYWTTSHSVECARLNGEEPRKYFQTGFFSGKKVMGLALDHDHKRVIWMVWSFEGAKLYHAPMASYFPVAREELFNSIVTEYLGPFPEDALQGSIRYFSDHLYWLPNPNEAVISDLSGQNAAHLYNSGLVDLSSLVIVDPVLQPYPDNLTAKTVQVIPDAVNGTTVTVNGVWKDFNISWNRVSNMNHGQVFYEIGIGDETDDHSSSIVSEYPFYVYPHLRPLPPYSKITVSVRAYSYWGSSPRVVTTVYSPMSVPSEPLRPRVFVTSATTGSLHVEFRWSPPKRPNGIILGYVVTVWNSDTYEQKSSDPIWEENIPRQDNLVYVNKRLNHNTTYIFEVRAYTAVGEGPQSDSAQATTNYESPVPKLLLVKEDAIQLADMDSHEVVTVTFGAVRPSDVAYLWADGTVFWLDQNSNSLFRSNVDGTDKVKLHSLTFSGDSLSVDWVGRHLYWSEVDEINRNSSIWSLDVDRKRNPKVVLSTGTRIGTIVFDPFTSTLLWTSISWNGVGTVMKCKPDGSQLHSLFSTSKEDRRIQRDSHVLKHENEHKYKKPKALQTEGKCPHNVAVASAITLDTTSVNHNARRLLFVEAQHRLLWTSDLEGGDCHLLLNGSNHGFPPTSLTVDSNRIYWSNATTKHVYSIRKLNPKAENSGNDAIPTSDVIDGVRGIEAFGSRMQPYPDVKCLTPPPYDKPPTIGNVTDTTITVHLDAFIRDSENCCNVSMASVLYTIYYMPLNDENSVDACEKNITYCLTLDTYELTAIVTGLQPFTTYSFRVAVSNFYTERRSEPGPSTKQSTDEGVPPKPKIVAITVVSPEAVDVSWDSPESTYGPMVSFTVYWRRKLSSSNTVSVTSSNDNFNTSSNITKPLHHLVTGLDPGDEYTFWVRAHASSGTRFNESNEVTVQLFNNPDNLHCNNVTSTSLVLSWKSPNTSVITRHALKYKRASETSEVITCDFEATEPGHNYNFVVHNLVPKSRYIFWLLMIYNFSNGFVYQWPRGDKFTYETFGDFPGPPGAPEVLGIQRDMYKVLWRPSDARGGVQLAYILEVNRVDGDADSTSRFMAVYNGSDTKWTMVGLDPNARYIFRVCAYNEYGVGNFSDNSPSINFSESSGQGYGSTDEQLAIVLGATVPVLFLLLAGISYVLFKVHRRREKEKKILQEIVLNSHNPELELATLRDLPQNHDFIHQNNALYAQSDIPSDAELAALPHVSSNQIVLIKFLGCGAFGEVFEGIARTLPGESETDIRVAIKTLRKGATDHEKTEFLKEAQLMSNFKHNHILSLLGVCLDNDPNFLILELMDGGDLLSYLRNNRPTAFSSSQLSSQDLISICVDVAHGCCHLEDMHFIHRDLAARNCLVSSHDCSQRTVKIGDFGLARDIYKNDYYRKEGEGLLPVRWMSPESLVDGVFTSQSDVWAFGVLLWEVMTLGQQPYPARTNVEVLHYVRGGGRLDKPDNCPDDLHQLMLKCWSYNPSERPTFRYCLDKLQELRRKSSQIPSTTNNNNSVHNQNYLGRQEAAGGVDNLAYTSDENVRSLTGDAPSRAGSSVPRTRVSEAETASIVSATSETRNECRRLASETDNDDTVELLEKQRQSCGSHRYLELLYDNDLPPEYESDGGYEIPLSSSIRRKCTLVPGSAYAKDDEISVHTHTYARSDARRRTKSDCSMGSSDGSIPPIFRGGVPRVSDGDDCSHTSHSTDGGVEETDDAKQLAATYGRVVHRSRRRGASQPLLCFRFDELPKTVSPQSRGSVASVGDIETSSTRKSILVDGQLFCGSSAPLLEASSVHRHHRGHKPWRVSSVSLGTDASTSSDGIGPTDPSTDATSCHLSGISALSALSSSSTSGIDMDYSPTSTWC